MNGRKIHGLSHYDQECVGFKHIEDCTVCLFACHIDRGDWIFEKMCDQGKQILEKEELLLEQRKA